MSELSQNQKFLADNIWRVKETYYDNKKQYQQQKNQPKISGQKIKAVIRPLKTGKASDATGFKN